MNANDSTNLQWHFLQAGIFVITIKEPPPPPPNLKQESKKHWDPGMRGFLFFKASAVCKFGYISGSCITGMNLFSVSLLRSSSAVVCECSYEVAHETVAGLGSPARDRLHGWIMASHALRDAVIGEEEEEDGADGEKWILLDSAAEPSRTVDGRSLCSVLPPPPPPLHTHTPICKTKKQKERRRAFRLSSTQMPQGDGSLCRPPLLCWAMLLLAPACDISRNKLKESAPQQQQYWCQFSTFTS